MQEMSMKKAVLIHAAGKYSSVVVNFLISIVLSRLLSPTDYGVVAVVMAFIGFFNILSNLGFGAAVIQRQDFNSQQQQDVFTFTEYFSLILMIAFAILAWPISWVYSDDVYIPISLALSISVLFNALNMIPNAILLREKKFLIIGIRMIILSFAGGIVAVVMALLGFKYYSLVGQSVFISALQFFWNFNSTKLRFRIKFDFKTIKSIFSYSISNFAYDVTLYIAQNIDHFLTGKYLGAAALGYYNKSYTLMRYPVNNLSIAITPALHPMLAARQDDKDYLYMSYIRIAKVFSLLSAFILPVCFWAGDEIIFCLFGDQWGLAVLPFRILSLSIGVQMINSVYPPIYKSLGCTAEMFQSSLWHIGSIILANIIGISFLDINVLALSVCIAIFFRFFVDTIYLNNKCFKVSPFKFLKYLAPDLLICFVLFSVLLVFSSFVDIANPWVSLCVKIIITGLMYLLLLAGLKQVSYLTVILPAKIRNKINR